MYKYYKFNLMNNSFKYFALFLLLVAMTGCTADDIVQAGGTLPDETPMNSVGGQLHSGKTFSNMITVGMYQDDGPATEEIIYTLTKPATTPVTIKAVSSPELVAKYNSDNSTEMKEFPIENVTFENGGSLTVPTGKKISENISITLSPEGLEAGTLYLLAITLEQELTGIDAQATKQVIYYRIGFMEKITTCNPDGQIREIPPLMPDLTSVFYVNTETYQPLIAAAWAVQVDFWEPIFSLGNIVNLKRATIGYDVASQRASLELGSDLSYVLGHRDKYIRHLQEYEREVCLCIENGGQGIGFCNMNDNQITDFVRQVKAVVELYYLDGVNLWDDDSKYGKAGMPELNTTSYPLLIKKLREALPGKLLTVVDKGNATEYFYDVDKCGGIEVGKCIDYAWHGYSSPTEELQIINPNSDGSAQAYSKYTRKPIAGLNEIYYGNVNAPCYNDNSRELKELAEKTIAQWRTKGGKKNNIMVYGSDLIGSEYGGYETAVQGMLSPIANFMDDGNGWDFDNNDISWGTVFYSGYWLDWTLNAGPDADHYKKDW